MKRNTPRSKLCLLVMATVILSEMYSGRAAAGEAAIAFSYKDWDLHCDNTLTCRAAGYAVYGTEQGATVLLTRQAGRGTPVINRVMLAHYDDRVRQENSPPELIISGHSAGPLTFAEDESWQMNDTQTALLFTALKKDDPIIFRENGQVFSLSNDGSNAVLLKMDDIQGRVNTAEAIFRKGKNHESTVREPLAAPIIISIPVTDKSLHPMVPQESATIKPSLMRLLTSGKEQYCSNDRLVEPWEIAQLDQYSSLVSAPCWQGAYNSGNVYFVISNDMQSPPIMVSNSATDYENGKISSSMKERVLGDCWRRQTWIWNGNTFVESAKSNTGRCMLIRPGGAWDIPEYVSQVMDQ